jgi:hypothetical protein
MRQGPGSRSQSFTCTDVSQGVQELPVVFTLTANDIDAAATFMQAEASKHWNTGKIRPDREKCSIVAQWAADEYSAGYTNEAELRLRARRSAYLKEKCGSIWLMLLGSLLINLFVRWLFSKEQP